MYLDTHTRDFVTFGNGKLPMAHLCGYGRVGLSADRKGWGAFSFPWRDR
jgi:hypothetical protein